ncbi:MAG: hypothetical protein Q9170_002951 [Blastenia crenularia]
MARVPQKTLNWLYNALSSRSSIEALLPILQDVFAREPPVITRQDRFPQTPPTPQNTSVPPPIPPLPPELEHSESSSSQITFNAQPTPPPRPPKADGSYVEHHPSPANGAPPVPPHPVRGGFESHAPATYQQGAAILKPPISQYQQYSSQRVSSLRSEYGPGAALHHQQVHRHIPPQQTASPVSPMTPLPNQSFARHDLPTHGRPQARPHLSNAAHGTTPTVWQQSQHQAYQYNPQPQPSKPKPPEDLLTSPFETTLPAPATEITPPPIPPNPQRDAVLQALSQTLTQQVQSGHASNMSAVAPLRAQQAALNEALNGINHEISQLNNLQALLDSNEKILRQAMVDADKVLDDAKRRDVPAVEEVLVAPTVVAGQLYENVIEERVLEECRIVVGKALDKGRIGGDIWAKQTRSLAREEFLKKALIKKISRGMGLVEEERWD